MDPRSLRVLEYPAVLDLLAGQTACSLGREKALSAHPHTQRRDVDRALRETSEALVLMGGAGIPLGGVTDVRSLVARAGADGVLEPLDLLSVGTVLFAAKRLRGVLSAKPDDLPLMSDLGAQISDLSHIAQSIERSISLDGEVKDGASDLLAQLRNSKRGKMRHIQELLQRILNSSRTRDLLQEPVITVRNDRYCLSVKAEKRREFGGLVHDASASGQTLFMEPASVVEAGNELREIEAHERTEVQRILRVLSRSIGAESRRILATVDVLAEVDYISARAHLADMWHGVVPDLLDKPGVEMYGARHPLLFWQAIEKRRAGETAKEPRDQVVPIDPQLGLEFRSVIITGPNTGGKTVTLKTVGLMVLLAQTGIPIPCDTARIGIFKHVFADIGDEQSLQQSLSTFSGHIRNIVEILKSADASTLVLLDEIGAGTDPAEGAALAKAILLALSETGASVMATTHYAELKEFAWNREGFQNASVEFDVETLKPTYRLRLGVPGASNALTIAGRLGMPESVLERARGNLGSDRLALESAIARMEESERASRRATIEAERKVKELEAQRRHVEEELSEAKDKRKAATEAAYEEALAFVRTAREEAAEVLRTLRELGEETRETDAALKRLQQLETVARQKRVKPRRKPTHRIETESAPQPGDSVWVPSLGGIGVLVEVRRDEATVQAGALRLTADYATLQKVADEAAPAKSEPVRRSSSSIALEAASTISPEVHLRHMRAEEAFVVLDKYMDSARLAGLHTIRIVHGKGGGILRDMAHRYLKDQPDVRSFRLGSPEEGGHGVTIAELA